VIAMQVPVSRRRSAAFARLGLVVVTAAGAVATVGVGSAGAVVSGMCGTVASAPLPPSLRSDTSEENGRFQLFAEARQKTLAVPVAVDITAPGTYDQPIQLPFPAPVLLPGTVVSSFLLHSDPVGQPQPGQRLTATLSFDSDILGVMVQNATLSAADAILGVAGTIYPKLFEERGLELAPKVDFVRLTGPRSLEVSVQTGTVSDEVRIVTAGAGDTAPTAGYQLIASDGGVFSFGNQHFSGSTGAMRLNSPIVASAGSCGHDGYWLAAADGGIFNFGDAGFYGSLGSLKLNAPIVGMASTETGLGYWMVASDGGVFNFGDAEFRGSAGKVKLSSPIIGMAATPTGKGYWLVAADGGIFNYGDAGFYGSTGAIKLNKPIVGMAATPTGKGYWLVASDGGIFSFGDASFFGSTGAMTLNQPIVDMVVGPSGEGYWLIAADGGVFTFGVAPFMGSTGAIRLNRPIIAAL
jgi:hypothetical protein